MNKIPLLGLAQWFHQGLCPVTFLAPVGSAALKIFRSLKWYHFLSLSFKFRDSNGFLLLIDSRQLNIIHLSPKPVSTFGNELSIPK